MLWRARTPTRAKRSAPAGFIVPCAPTILGRPPAGPRWLHEIKQDGYRIIARREGDEVRLWTRLQNECSGRFLRIAAALRALPVTSCTIDGEAVVLRPDGHSDFHALRSSAGAAAAVLIAFDLLELAGEDLRCQPLEDRRARLAALLAPRRVNTRKLESHKTQAADHNALVFSESFEGEGADIFGHACNLGLEGIVSKRRESIYRSGRSGDWIKTINPGYARSP